MKKTPLYNVTDKKLKNNKKRKNHWGFCKKNKLWNKNMQTNHATQILNKSNIGSWNNCFKWTIFFCNFRLELLSFNQSYSHITINLYPNCLIKFSLRSVFSYNSPKFISIVVDKNEINKMIFNKIIRKITYED